MFYKSAWIATAMGLLAATAPALASESRDAATVMKAQIVEKGGQTLYCIKQATTGSRMSRRFCMTGQEWNAAGAHIMGENIQLVASPKVPTTPKK